MFCISPPRVEIRCLPAADIAGLMVVVPTTGGDRIVIVDYYISGVVPKSLSSLDAKRALYPVNDIKVFYKYIAKNVTNFW